MDVLHQEMCPVSYRRIHMTIEITSDSPAFVVVVNLLLPTAIAKEHSNNYFKLKQRRSIAH
jgi:hypothetical protein